MKHAALAILALLSGAAPYMARAGVTLGLANTNVVVALAAEIPAVPTWTETNTTAVIVYNYGVETVAIPSGGTLTADITGWPAGDQCFIILSPAGSYSVNTNTLTKVGYGDWPTNTAQCVAWAYSSMVYLTVIKQQ